VTLPEPPEDPSELRGLPHVRWDAGQPLYRTVGATAGTGP
jgi:hypothetical protein